MASLKTRRDRSEIGPYVISKIDSRLCRNSAETNIWPVVGKEAKTLFCLAEGFTCSSISRRGFPFGVFREAELTLFASFSGKRRILLDQLVFLGGKPPNPQGRLRRGLGRHLPRSGTTLFAFGNRTIPDQGIKQINPPTTTNQGRVWKSFICQLEHTMRGEY
jgi:hypothetical protein